jgi:hypothetical protein
VIYVYGHLPVHYSTLKDLDLDHNGVGIGTISLVSANDEEEFRDAVVLLDTALKAATANDLGATWNATTGQVEILSATAKAWEITSWPARGFFGFQNYPINETDQPNGSNPHGAAGFVGLNVETAEQATRSETRRLYADSYAASDGLVVSLRGLAEWETLPPDWSTYLGHLIADGGAGAWTLANPDGELDGRLVDAGVRGKRTVLGQSYVSVRLQVAVS